MRLYVYRLSPASTSVQMSCSVSRSDIIVKSWEFRRNHKPPCSVYIRCRGVNGYVYALMTHDCASALTAAGLDPDVGFLHADRPGRPSLALDLVEEFRTLIADRLVLALINRQQLGRADFRDRDGGSIELTTDGRKSL